VEPVLSGSLLLPENVKKVNNGKGKQNFDKKKTYFNPSMQKSVG
jgi:hypothetical protein